MTFTESMLSDLCNLALEDGFAESLNKTLSQFDSGTNSIIVNLMRNSVFAIGAALLTLFMLMELVAMVNRSDSMETGLGSLKLPSNIMIKFAVFAFLFCHIPAILNGIESTAASIGNSMVTNAKYNFGVGVSASQITALAEGIDDLSFFSKIFTYIVVFVCWLFVSIVKGIVSLTTVFRIFELWILLLFAPIPLATLASPDFRQTAINYLKTFTAVCLQGSAIIACFLIYNALMSTFVRAYDSSIDVSEFINSFLLQNILYAAALAVSIFSSGKIIKQVMNAV